IAPGIGAPRSSKRCTCADQTSPGTSNRCDLDVVGETSSSGGAPRPPALAGRCGIGRAAAGWDPDGALWPGHAVPLALQPSAQRLGDLELLPPPSVSG